VAIRYQYQHVGSHHGQEDQRVLAINESNWPIGWIEYTEFRGRTHIDIIRVEPGYRRQGIAERLVLHMLMESKGPVDLGMLTDAGARFFRRFLCQHKVGRELDRFNEARRTLCRGMVVKD